MGLTQEAGAREGAAPHGPGDRNLASDLQDNLAGSQGEARHWDRT